MSREEDIEALSRRLGEYFSTIASSYDSIRNELQPHADGKVLKGDEIVGWLGEVYAKVLLGGTLVADSFEHDVEADGKYVSVKARKGWKSGWTRTSAIPKVVGPGCPSHLMFVHLNDDFSLDRAWLYPWADMLAQDRFRPHVVRGSQRSFIFQVNQALDRKYLEYPPLARMEDAMLSNKKRLEDGLDIFVVSMRDYVKGRLIAKIGDRWWEEGVLRAVDGRPPFSEIGPRELQRIISFHFDNVFGAVFGKQGATRAQLEVVIVARNDTKHKFGGPDFDARRVERDLNTMVFLLEEAGLQDAAQRIEGLLGKAAVPAGQPVRSGHPRGKTIVWSSEQASALKKRRLQKGLTQARVAELAEIDRRRYSWIEYPKIVVPPRQDELDRINRVLGTEE